MLKELTDLFIKYNIDYPSLLIINDLINNTDYFVDYFQANQGKYERNNIERGTLTNLFVMLNNKLISNTNIQEQLSQETLDKYYKNFKLTDRAKTLYNEYTHIINKYKNINTIKSTVTNNVNTTKVSDWIDEYRTIWTDNYKMMKTNAMGSKQMCIDKMEQFISTYPQYTKETIIAAAKKYVSEYMRDHNYDSVFLITAPYFIKRQRNAFDNNENSSMRLVDYCELILNEQNYIDTSLPINEQGELA